MVKLKLIHIYTYIYICIYSDLTGNLYVCYWTLQNKLLEHKCTASVYFWGISSQRRHFSELGSLEIDLTGISTWSSRKYLGICSFKMLSTILSDLARLMQCHVLGEKIHCTSTASKPLGSSERREHKSSNRSLILWTHAFPRAASQTCFKAASEWWSAETCIKKM